jgi:putative N6-adenine-specific DNA methylase
VVVPAFPRPNQLDAFAVTAPGLEALCAAELRALGITATVQDGGAAWTGDTETIARANLWSRTASRVLVRIGDFRARTFFELERHARRLPWDGFLAPNAAAAFRVTSRKSKLYHSSAVAQRLGEALIQRVPGASVKSASGDDDDSSAPEQAKQLFVVRVLHDVVTVSADSSGALLHLRGYRQQLAKAPLRETLAAALLLAASWSGDVPLFDPMCGSGTIPIEAARLARRMAPGRDRSFGFLHWPGVDARIWRSLVERARSQELPSSPVPIAGADRDGGAILAARANARRAGVAGDVDFLEQPISAMAADAGAGLVATNPPYGVRVGEADRLRDLYAQLGNLLRTKRPDWRLAMFSADRGLERQLHLPLEDRLRTRNGGIAVRVVTAPPQAPAAATARPSRSL